MGHSRTFAVDNSDVVSDARSDCSPISARTLQSSPSKCMKLPMACGVLWVMACRIKRSSVAQKVLLRSTRGNLSKRCRVRCNNYGLFARDNSCRCLPTHFHYVNGTTAITEQRPVKAIWGHERIEHNLERSATEIAPAYTRGLIEQFGIYLPDDGPDGLVNVGLGLACGWHTTHHRPPVMSRQRNIFPEIVRSRSLV